MDRPELRTLIVLRFSTIDHWEVEGQCFHVLPAARCHLDAEGILTDWILRVRYIRSPAEKCLNIFLCQLKRRGSRCPRRK